MEWIEIFYGVSTILLGLYYWSTWNHNYWKSRKVVGPAPTPLIGNLGGVILAKKSLGMQMQTIYTKYREEPAIGIYLLSEPVLLLTDLDLVKDLIIRDFSNFVDRGLLIYEKVEPLTQHLVNLEPARWRPVRKSIAPGFSSHKVKEMFHRLLECGDQLENYLNKLCTENEIVDCRELTAKFGTDAIGTYAYSIRMDAVNDEASDFRRMGKTLFEPGWRNVFRMRLRESSPFLYSTFGHLFCDSHITGWFGKMLIDMMDYRKKNGIVTNDVVDLVMDLRDHPDKLGGIEVTDSLLTSQLFSFFIAGFETTSTAMSNTIYELAQNHSIQDKLRNEIHDALAKNNGQLSYEIVKSMKYLDMVFNETLRKYPPVCTLTRRAASDYTFAGTKITLPKGFRVLVPVFSIHRDPKIYPNPEVFDPERFTKEAIAARHPMSFIPFGGGPKTCLGINFGTYQSKVGIIKILQNHKVDVCEKTQIPYVINPRTIFLTSTKAINVKVSKVN